MSEAEKILEMIENVSPDDTDTLDEIDARVWCYLEPAHFVKMATPIGFHCEHIIMEGVIIRTSEPKYTRSRDALKSIRPEGWVFNSKELSVGWLVSLWLGYDEDGPEVDAICSTEELAELHAIIQAIEWTRQNDQ